MASTNVNSLLRLDEIDKKVDDFYDSIPIENSNNRDMAILEDCLKEAICILHLEINGTVAVRKGIKKETSNLEFINKHYNGVFFSLLLLKKFDLCKRKIAIFNR